MQKKNRDSALSSPEVTDEEELECPECGMPESEWRGNEGDGIVRGGLRYCCEGCADGTGCTCEAVPSPEEDEM